MLLLHGWAYKLGVIQARSIPHKRSRHFPATTAGGVEMKAQGLPKMACFGKPFLENTGHSIVKQPKLKLLVNEIIPNRACCLSE
jgi:hypothetical protein